MTKRNVLDMHTFAELIEKFGGAAKLAGEIGEQANAIRQWSARNSIPARHWHSIVEAAARLQVPGVTFEALAGVASGRPASIAAPVASGSVSAAASPTAAAEAGDAS